MPFILLLLAIIGIASMFSKDDKYYSDDSYYERKYKQEEIDRKKDISKMLQEYKYQEYKSKQ